MIERITVLLLLLVLGASVSEAGSGAFELDLETTVRRTLDHSFDYQIAKLQEANADIDRRIQALDANLTEDERLKQELAWRGAQERLDATYYAAVTDAIDNYFRLTRLDRDAQIAQMQLEISEANFHLAQRRAALGELSDTALLNETAQYEVAQARAKLASGALAQAWQELSRLTGITYAFTEVSMVSVVPQPTFALSLASVRQQAAAHSFEVWERETNLRLQRFALQKVQLQSVGPLELQRAENTFAIAQLTADRAEAMWTKRIVDSWQSVQHAQTQVKLAETAFRLAADDYASKAKQYATGLVSESQLLMSEITLLQETNTVAQRQLEYLLAVIHIEHLTTRDFWPIGVADNADE